MGYIAMSSVVYFIMNMLGEMTTYLPVRGVSVPYFISRFTEPSLGFAVGMLNLLMCVMMEPLLTISIYRV